MDFTPVVASVLAAFVTASVTSWAALRTTNTTWHAAHADRTFDAVADLLAATDLGLHDGSCDLGYVSAATRVRITTSDPLRGFADALIKAADDFTRTNTAEHWRRSHPYFSVFDYLHKSAKSAETLIRQYEDEAYTTGIYVEELTLRARDDLVRFYAQQDSGEDPDPAPVRKALQDSDYFGPESDGLIDNLLISPVKRRAFQQGLAKQQSKHAERRAALVSAHKHLASAVAAWSTTPPARLARTLRRGK